MKRGDILTGVVYGYSEDRAYIHRYGAVVILSLDSYFRPRYGDRMLQPAAEPRERLNRGGWRTHTAPVGLLGVMLSDTGLANLDEVMARATPEAAVRAMNDDVLEGARNIQFGVDAQTGQPVYLGTYVLVTNGGDLHGIYAELVAAREEQKRLTDQAAQVHEEARLAMLAEYRGLERRLRALGITGYDVRDYEHPSRFEGLRFEDMEHLLDLAEDGALMRSKE